MKRHRVAVVGCGALARGAHPPNCRRNRRVELAAVCDIDPRAAEQCREEFGAALAETDWRRIVAVADIDGCVLCTHTSLRGEFIVPALESGKAVYAEKPLAPSRKEMLDIVLASRRTGRPVCVGHNRRSSPAVLEFKRLLDKLLDKGPVRPGDTIALNLVRTTQGAVDGAALWFPTLNGCLHATDQFGAITLEKKP